MPITTGENYAYLNNLLSKNNGQHISISEYIQYANIASNEMFDDFLGIKTTPRIVLGKNRLVDTRLLPFKRKLNTTFTNEVLTKPANCRYISAVYTRPARIPVKPLDDDRQAMIMQDPLASPNGEDKYYVDNGTQLQLLGEETLPVTLEYYERPTPATYVYTTGTNGRPVYDSVNSLPLGWDISEQEELTNRILAKAGLSLQNQLEIQVANNNKNQE